MLRGKLVVLKPLEWEDLEQVHTWYQDPEVLYWSSGNHPDTFFSRYDLEEQYEREARGESIRRFMIETHDGTQLGVISYKNMNRQIHSVMIGLFIGEKEYWGKGHGTDAVRAFLRYLFHQHNFNRVELETWAGNERAVRTYEKCGFQIEGRIREGFYVDGQYCDKLIMGILRRDFDQIKDTW